jgi:hypothetical protein
MAGNLEGVKVEEKQEKSVPPSAGASRQAGYSPKYGDTCDCPYCGEAQSVDVELDSWINDEEIDCDDCGGTFKYNLEVTIEFSCYPIEGEGPKDENGEVRAPRFVDPNQLSLLDSCK